MKYITSIERIAIAKGQVEGRVEGESKLLKRQLERRFGVLPAWATEKLSNASESALEAWVISDGLFSRSATTIIPENYYKFLCSPSKENDWIPVSFPH